MKSVAYSVATLLNAPSTRVLRLALAMPSAVQVFPSDTLEGWLLLHAMKSVWSSTCWDKSGVAELDELDEWASWRRLN